MHTSSRSGARMKISTPRVLKTLGVWSSPRLITLSTVVRSTVISMDVVFGISLEIPWWRLTWRPRISRWGELSFSLLSTRSHSPELAYKFCHLPGIVFFSAFFFFFHMSLQWCSWFHLVARLPNRRYHSRSLDRWGNRKGCVKYVSLFQAGTVISYQIA